MSDSREAMKREPKLVRARPKAVEYLPQWAKCCAEKIAATLAEGEIILDIAQADTDYGLTCRFCGADMPEDSILVPDVGCDEWVHIEEYDLDEGVLTACENNRRSGVENDF